MTFRRSALLVLAVTLLAGTAGAGDLPSWAAEAMKAPSADFGNDAEAIVLLQEGSLEVVGGDQYIERERRVVRILTGDGRDEAIAHAVYRKDAGKVRSLRAWIVPPGGKAREISSKEVVEISVAGNDVYNEARNLLLSGMGDAVAGSTFAWESIVDGRHPFAQFEWYVQGPLPTAVSDFSFRVPSGWSVRSTVRSEVAGGAPPVADNNAGLWHWRWENLSRIKDEPFSPPWISLAPRIRVSAIPPPSMGAGEGMRAFGTWADVGAWLNEMAEPGSVLTTSISSKARALTAGATTQSEIIRRVARHCQSVNYISIQMGVSRGGGYAPHAADQVLAKGYGDCKDKSNLMRCLLKSLGVQSYLCTISAFDPTYVTESWPTPAQFDHCILAIRSDDSASCAVSVPSLGRLVFFDPTDPSTQWGDLPQREQGGWALVASSSQGNLVRVPCAAPARSRHVRRIEGRLTRDGTLIGRMTIDAAGASASMLRDLIREKGIEGTMLIPQTWLGSGVGGATVDSFIPEERDDGSFAVRAAFRAPRFAQPLGGNLIALEPGRFSGTKITAPPPGPRRVPIVLPTIAESERFNVAIPNDLRIEGVPAPAAVESRFGRCSAVYRVEGDSVEVLWDVEIAGAVIPATDYGALRDFLIAMKRVSETPLVLVRK